MCPPLVLSSSIHVGFFIHLVRVVVYDLKNELCSLTKAFYFFFWSFVVVKRIKHIAVPRVFSLFDENLCTTPFNPPKPFLLLLLFDAPSPPVVVPLVSPPRLQLVRRQRSVDEVMTKTEGEA